MYYRKPALTFEQQAQQLLNRGLLGIEKSQLIERLQNVNYYRLSAYWYPFKRFELVTGEECFAPNTTFEKIWRYYVFDKKLRLIMMDAIEKIEISVLRTRMVEHFSRAYGPFGYCKIGNFNPNWELSDYSKWMREIDISFLRSKEDFVERYKRKYMNETKLPLWMAVEVMTFGQLFTLFRNLNKVEKQKISFEFDLYPPVMESWLKTLNYIRNVCAHHGRLWNRELSIRPIIPDKKHHPEWYIPIKPNNKRVYSVLTLLQYLNQFIAPDDSWFERLRLLLSDYPEISPPWMGFPEDWQLSPIWK